MECSWGALLLRLWAVMHVAPQGCSRRELLKVQNTNKFCSIKQGALAASHPQTALTQQGVGRARPPSEERLWLQVEPTLQLGHPDGRVGSCLNEKEERGRR